jgi:hypothetical protein
MLGNADQQMSSDKIAINFVEKCFRLKNMMPDFHLLLFFTSSCLGMQTCKSVRISGNFIDCIALNIGGVSQ